MDNVLGLSDDEFLKQNQGELSATEDSQESTDTVTPEGDIADNTITMKSFVALIGRLVTRASS